MGEAEGLVAVGALDEGDVLASALLTDSRQVLGEADLEGSKEGARVSVSVSGRLPGVLQEGAEARGAEGPVHQRDDLQDVVSLVHNEGDVMSEDMAGDPLHHSLEGTEKVHVEGLDEGGRAGRDVVHLQLLARGHEGGDGGVILERGPTVDEKDDLGWSGGDENTRREPVKHLVLRHDVRRPRTHDEVAVGRDEVTAAGELASRLLHDDEELLG